MREDYDPEITDEEENEDAPEIEEEIPREPRSVTIKREAPNAMESYPSFKASSGSSIEQYFNVINSNERLKRKFNLKAGKWLAEVKQGENGEYEVKSSNYVARPGDTVLFRDKPKTEGC